MASSHPVVIRENWETYSYVSDGGPVFATFYAGAKGIAREDFPYCARVIIRIRQPNENGGPTSEEAETLWGLEDNLTDALSRSGGECILVGRLTHAGDRELVFQLADWDRFRPPVGRWIQQNPTYDIDVSEHDGWEFFDEYVWPTDEDWMFIHDSHVVNGLIESGSDPEKEHCLEYVFVGDQSNLQRLRDKLTLRGYADYGSPVPADQLVMVKKLPLDLRQIYAESLENQRLCNEIGAAFDGWGAAVVK